MIPMSGVYEIAPIALFHSAFGKDESTYKKASPLHHVKGPHPPAPMIYADKDYLTIDQMSERFCKKLDNCQCKAATLKVANRDHISIIVYMMSESDPTTQAILQFVATHSGLKLRKKGWQIGRFAIAGRTLTRSVSERCAATAAFKGAVYQPIPLVVVRTLPMRWLTHTNKVWPSAPPKHKLAVRSPVRKRPKRVPSGAMTQTPPGPVAKRLPWESHFRPSTPPPFAGVSFQSLGFTKTLPSPVEPSSLTGKTIQEPPFVTYSFLRSGDRAMPLGRRLLDTRESVPSLPLMRKTPVKSNSRLSPLARPYGGSVK